jgi:O-antigen ligase
MGNTETTGSDTGKFARPSNFVGYGVLAGWLTFLLVGSTIGFGWIDSWHNEQRSVQVILLALTALAFSVLVALRHEPLRIAKAPAVLACAFFGLGIVSALHSGHPKDAIAEIALAVLLLTLAALTAILTVRAPERIAVLASWFALLYCTAYCLGVAVRLVAAIELSRGIDLDVLLFGYANPRFASAFFVALIPFVSRIGLDRSEAKWLRAIAIAVLTVVWGINWGLGTRGVWFAYLLALPALAILAGWTRVKPLAALMTFTALSGVGCFELLAYAIAPAESTATVIARPTSNATLTSREVLWQLSWGAIRASPLLGIGPMNFAALGSQVGAHPHNWILQVAVEWGIPAALVVGALVILLGVRIRKVSDGFGVAVGCSVLASGSLALVDGNLVMPITQSAFALTVGLLVGVTRPGSGSQSVAIGPVLATLALTASIFLGAYASSTFAVQDAARVLFPREHPGVWLLPRFWEHGLL